MKKKMNDRKMTTVGEFVEKSEPLSIHWWEHKRIPPCGTPYGLTGQAKGFSRAVKGSGTQHWRVLNGGRS